jgi:hypothetical protein
VVAFRILPRSIFSIPRLALLTSMHHCFLNSGPGSNPTCD